MRTYLSHFFAISLLCMYIPPVFAQYHAIHEIDSVMDMSPYYLPTSYAQLRSIYYKPLKFKPIDTTMIVTHLFDPLYKTENIYQGLGISGQAHQSIIFDYQREMGFLYQTLPYPLFFKNESNLTFYKLKTTYSKIAYTLGLPKENEVFAEFAKYIKGVTVVANMYTTLNDGSFVHQKTRNICGDFLIHYENPSSTYGFRASYIINYLDNFENGGLLDINSYQNDRRNIGYAVRSPNENTKSIITTHDFLLQNYVNIKDKKQRYYGTIAYNFQLGQSTIRYNDVFDTIYPYYATYFSDKTTNDSIRIFNIQNAIQWSNFKPFQEESVKRNFFHIAGGVMHDYANFRYTRTPFNSFYLFARTHIRLFNIMDITGDISYSVLSDYKNNDIIAKAGISWAINREKEHSIGFNAQFYRNTPEYIMQYVFTNNFRWVNDFQEQNILQLKAFWNYQQTNFSVSYYYLNKLVYLSEELRPVQNENNGNLIQISTFIPFRYKNFGTTANLNFQYCTKDVVNVPLFAGKLSVFYIIELLKKRLKIQVGTDFMYNTTYYADAYLPVLHKFYYQRTQLIGNFVFWDVNVTFQIDRINFFFRAGNLLAPFMHYRNFTTPNYPIKDYFLSLGISWKFYD